MKKLEEIIQDKRFHILDNGFDGMSGFVYSKTAGASKMVVIASWAGGWEHVSVSLKKTLSNLGRDVHGEGHFLSGR